MFSVVMPLWNKRHTVAEAVASVLGQTFRDFELIIVDDGSTDGSLDALSGLDDPRIRTISQANAGPGRARNRGIEESRHDWIAFLDADDLWSPDHLAELERVRRLFPQAGLIGTSYALPDWNGRCYLSEANQSRIAFVDYFENSLRGYPPFSASSSAIPRSTFVALGGFGDVERSEDSEYWARIALERPVALSSKVTAAYRHGDGGRSRTAAAAALGRRLRNAGDLSPVLALLLERYPTISCPDMRRAVDDYVDFRIRLSARAAARIGDLQTLRELPAVHLRPPRLQERLIFAAARLPPLLARSVYRLGFRAKALLRLLKRTSRILDRRARARKPWPMPPDPGSSRHGE